jgi:hypothetical protein
MHEYIKSIKILCKQIELHKQGGVHNANVNLTKIHGKFVYNSQIVDCPYTFDDLVVKILNLNMSSVHENACHD